MNLEVKNGPNNIFFSSYTKHVLRLTSKNAFIIIGFIFKLGPIQHLNSGMTVITNNASNARPK